jgi:hypothetical protein
MTRKDYVTIAEVFCDAYSTTVSQRSRNPASARDALEFAAHQMAARLAADNPRFDSARFR